MTKKSTPLPILKNKKLLIIGGASIALVVALISLSAIFLSPPSREDYQIAANDLRDAGTAYGELFSTSAFSRDMSTFDSTQIEDRTKKIEDNYKAYTTASDRLSGLKAWRNDEVSAAYEPYKAADEKVREEFPKVMQSYPLFAKVLSSCTFKAPLPTAIKTQADVDAFKETYKECPPALEASADISFEPYKKFADRINKYYNDLTNVYTDIAKAPRDDYLRRIAIGNDFYKLRSAYNMDLRELSATPEFAKELTRTARVLQKELNDKVAETK